MTTTWEETSTLNHLRAEQLTKGGTVFRHQRHVYRTLGIHISNGGMGQVYALERRDDDDGSIEQVVGKVFLPNYLVQLRTDEITRRDHHANLLAMTRVSALEHPNILPTYLSTAIADNYLFVTPRMGMTLLEAIQKHQLTPRTRTKLLMQALEGLDCLHNARLVHRDFTLRNILVDADANIAYLFDFDLAVSLDELGTTTYRNYYRGRIFGSPGWSVPPETIDQGLLDAVMSSALDIYAIGAALHGLFTDEMLYGPSDDMWALLLRIADGVVVQGRSTVHYPEVVPQVLRPVIEACLERDPNLRLPSVQTVVQQLRSVLRELPDDAPYHKRTNSHAVQPAPAASVASRASDPSITEMVVEGAHQAVWTWGYQIERSLGRVRGHPIFLAVPRADQLANGQFADANQFPKLVTVIDLAKMPDPRGFVEAWQQYYWPVLRKVRQGMMTSLHKVIYDSNTSSLLLFSEYIDEPRFGERIADVDLPIDGALALGFLVARQVAPLHQHGMAHNNIHLGSLLFKGVPATQNVLPAMIGLVEPAMGAEAMANDTRALATMFLKWMLPSRIGQLHLRIKPMFEAQRLKLTSWAYDRQVRAPSIDELLGVISDALALVDFNFSVLRDSGGDLVEYCILIVSFRLYHTLWPDAPAI
jgi:tRNA A-37 threonylcarbamoyl transferase component Bud32